MGLCLLASVLCQSQSPEIFAVMNWPKPAEYLLCASVCQALAWTRMSLLWGVGWAGWNPTSSLWAC